MLHLLDANVLITANNSYYGIDQVPEFWDWLQHQAASGHVKMPVEIMEEVKAGKPQKGKVDLLYDWIRHDDNETALLLDEDVDPSLVQHVVNDGYADDLTDNEIQQLGRDPFLIAYGLAQTDRCVITTEVSKPSNTRQNRKIPDVCNDLSVACADPFALYRTLGFSTSWRSS